MASPPPVARIVLSTALRIALAAAISTFAFYKVNWLAAILSIPVWGVLLAKPVVEFAETYFDFARKQPYQAWNGHYYAFEGTQIRVFEDLDEATLWFCDADILKVLGKVPEPSYRIAYPPPRYRLLPGTQLWAFSEDAVIDVVSHIRHPDMGKFRFWLDRQVIAPYRKRQEINKRTH